MIYLVGGARPNFMKIAAISRAFEKYDIDYEIIHTGQHYDYGMDKVFFKQFKLRDSLIHLEVGSGNHGEQTGRIMARFEIICLKGNPDMVFVVGDVNSTMAAALVAAKLHIPLAHQEAGMRSGDKKMPEEINRIVTDAVSDYLFPISYQHELNLIQEGYPDEKIFTVGDVMIDNLLYYSEEKIEGSNHVLVEIHRPSNTDDRTNLKEIIMGLSEIAKDNRVIFSVHPRTSKMISEFGLWEHLKNVDHRPPMGYFDFVKHMSMASVVITDSDGIQQETSVLDVPCIAIRDTSNIEYTIEYGTTTLVKPERMRIFYETERQIETPKLNGFTGELKELNDGKASERIAKIIRSKI